jgi:hypothetical protein
MGDLGSRILIVLAVVALIAIAAWVASWRARRRLTRSIPATGLPPGVYLLTARACELCDGARGRLSKVVGAEGFEELHREEEPTVFSRLEIDMVPSTLVVGPGGSGVWHPDVPRRLPTPGNP